MSDTESVHVLMTRVMKDIGAISKSQHNTAQNFKFRGIDDVMNALHGPLTLHGVHYAAEVVEWVSDRYTSKNNSNMRSVTVRMRYHFYGPSGDCVTTEGMGEAADSGDKAVPKALAIALKYALLHTFCIPTEEQAQDDPDAHIVEGAPEQEALPAWVTSCLVTHTRDQLTVAADAFRESQGKAPLGSFDAIGWHKISEEDAGIIVRLLPAVESGGSPSTAQPSGSSTLPGYAHHDHGAQEVSAPVLQDPEAWAKRNKSKSKSGGSSSEEPTAPDGSNDSSPRGAAPQSLLGDELREGSSSEGAQSQMDAETVR